MLEYILEKIADRIEPPVAIYGAETGVPEPVKLDYFHRLHRHCEVTAILEDRKFGVIDEIKCFVEYLRRYKDGFKQSPMED